MIKILYANGCSMTEGAELGNVQFKYDEVKYGANTFREMDSITEKHRQHIETHSWPYILKQTLGIENHFNNAFGGSCNRRILRTSIQDVENLLTAYQPNEILVAIGWSSFDRFEMYENAHFSQIVPKFHAKGKTDKSKKILAIDEITNTQLVDLYVRHLLEVICLKNYLVNKGIKYVFSYGLTTFIEVQFGVDGVNEAFGEYPELKSLMDLVEYDKWFFSPLCRKYEDHIDLVNNLHRTSFYCDTMANKYKTGSGQHPLEEGHAQWGKAMANHAINLGILK